jgi:hypothetical protein
MMTYTVSGDTVCVICGSAEHHEVRLSEGGGGNARQRVDEINEELRQQGWSRSYKGDWVCPNCSDTA